jgi:hypothetical protein
MVRGQRRQVAAEREQREGADAREQLLGGIALRALALQAEQQADGDGDERALDGGVGQLAPS